MDKDVHALFLNYMAAIIACTPFDLLPLGVVLLYHRSNFVQIDNKKTSFVSTERKISEFHKTDSFRGSKIETRLSSLYKDSLLKSSIVKAQQNHQDQFMQ